jgi:hypothetical protein
MKPLLVFVMITAATTSLYDPTQFSLSSNLLLNPAFSSPAISSPTAVTNYGNQITGWNCTSICQLKNMPRYCAATLTACNLSFVQTIDLDSENIF